MVQLESARLLSTTKSWLDRNVSTSEPNHKNALERVRGFQGGLGEQSQAPLVPWRPQPRCITHSTAQHMRLPPLTEKPEPGQQGWAEHAGIAGLNCGRGIKKRHDRLHTRRAAQTFKPRRAREGRNPLEFSIVPSGVYGGHGMIFASGNPIFQSKNHFLAVFAPGNLLDFSKNW